MKSYEITLKPIAYIRTDFPEKFGLPRQSMIVPELCGTVEFVPEFSSPDALRGLDGFSHIWLIWGFSSAFAHGKDSASRNFSSTVRPPRLGGNTRIGVFATRSPNRPNPIALSCVKLDSIENGVLRVSGIDMVDGTPIYDIKPYLPHVDGAADATGGFAAEVDGALLKVRFADGVREAIPPEKINGLIGALAEDPRPHYKSDGDRVYGFSYAGLEIGFTVTDGVLTVTSAHKE